MIKLSTCQLWVHDQDAALEFWTRKVGFEVREDVDDEDPNTTGVLDEVTEGLEKLAWLIKSENRKA